MCRWLFLSNDSKRRCCDCQRMSIGPVTRADVVVRPRQGLLAQRDAARHVTDQRKRGAVVMLLRKVARVEVDGNHCVEVSCCCLCCGVRDRRGGGGARRTTCIRKRQNVKTSFSRRSKIGRHFRVSRNCRHRLICHALSDRRLCAARRHHLTHNNTTNNNNNNN
jgi:hypothetical protein